MHSVVQPGFEGVADAFESLFADPDELGASFAVEIAGEPVVDLWGGIADPRDGRVWEHDTTTLIYSGTKGLTAMCLLLLWDRGLLEDDLPVSHYWPEFAAGKEGITVAQAISHAGGFPGLRRPYSFTELIDTGGFAELVAAEPPFWPAGTQIAYHAKTFGALGSELVRRIDGRTIGRFLHEEIAGPFGLAVWLGLPPHLEHRVSRLVRGYEYNPDFALAGPDLPRIPSGQLDAFRAMLYDPAPPTDGGTHWNTEAAHRAEVASSGAIATSRAMAHLYSALATDGTLDGRRLFSARAVVRAATVLARGYPPRSQFEIAFGPGFQIGEFPPSAKPHLLSVGHAGVGGSTHGAWPELGLSFSFLSNRLLLDHDRARHLLDAVYSVVR